MYWFSHAIENWQIPSLGNKNILRRTLLLITKVSPDGRWHLHKYANKSTQRWKYLPLPTILEIKLNSRKCDAVHLTDGREIFHQQIINLSFSIPDMKLIKQIFHLPKWFISSPFVSDHSPCYKKSGWLHFQERIDSRKSQQLTRWFWNTFLFREKQNGYSLLINFSLCKWMALAFKVIIFTH